LFDALVLPHLDRLLAFAVRRSDVRADAEDAVQETCVRAWVAFDELRDTARVRAWLYTIMRNRFLAGANRSTRSAAALEDIAAAAPPPTAGPGEWRLVLRDLTAALRRLPGNQRSAVILIGVEGKSYDEAAQTMGISAGAVRSHLMRGRDRLRTAMRGTDATAPCAPRPAGSPAAIAPRGMRAAPEAAAGAN